MDTSPVIYGGDEKSHAASGKEGRAYELPVAVKAGDQVFVVKCSSGGTCFLVPGVFADKAAAEALVGKRRGDGKVVALLVE
jgi:hypothetical protein